MYLLNIYFKKTYPNPLLLLFLLILNLKIHPLLNPLQIRTVLALNGLQVLRVLDQVLAPLARPPLTYPVQQLRCVVRLVDRVAAHVAGYDLSLIHI